MQFSTARMVRVMAFVACGLPGMAFAGNAEVLYKENFEETGVVEGAIVVGWPNTEFTFATSAKGYLMHPEAGGSAWLSPVHAELGQTFALLPHGALATVDTGVQFIEGQVYELTFTHFRRDDTDGLDVTASIGNSEGALAATTFEGVLSTGDHLTRSLKYTATKADAGQNIFLRFGEEGALANVRQAGIDNITLARVPK